MPSKRAFFVAWLLHLSYCALPQALEVYHLETDFQCQPLAVDVEHPVFSWKIRGNGQPIYQKAAKVLLAFDSAKLANGIIHWSSDEVNSTEVIYDGPMLDAHTRHFLQVVVTLSNEIVIKSPITWFETGYLNTSFAGSWLHDGKPVDDLSSPLFRKTFRAEKPVEYAKLYVATRGLHHAEINGRKVGKEILNPVFTNYNKRILYNAYDVTDYIQSGQNALGLHLGNGWYNHQSITSWSYHLAPWRGRPSFALNLLLRYEDGSVEIIESDPSWKMQASGYLFNSIYAGEGLTDKPSLRDWSTSTFDDEGWYNAQVAATPSIAPKWQNFEGIVVGDKLKPSDFNWLGPNHWFVQFPRNIAGFVEIDLAGFEGQDVSIKYGERGSRTSGVWNQAIAHKLTPSAADAGFQTDIIYLGQPARLRYASRFSYKGFQMVEVHSKDWRPLKLKEEDIVAKVIHSDVKPNSSFQCSDPSLNQVWESTNHSFLANLVGYPTDCPHREKNGWTGDGHIAARAMMYNYDTRLTMAKWMRDHQDAQAADGNIPMIVPTPDYGYETSTFDWTISTIVVPWMHYEHYGDLRILSDNFDMMQQFLDFWVGKSKNGLIFGGLGDWKAPVKESSNSFLASTLYYHALNIMSLAAWDLGLTRLSQLYYLRAEKTKKAIYARYYSPEDGTFANGSQTEQSFAIYYGLAEEHIDKVGQRLLESIYANDTILSVGLLGSRTLLPALTQIGQSDLAYRLATNPKTSWASMAGSRTQSMHESWTPMNESGGSLNHMYFGAINEWLLRDLGGIDNETGSHGFEAIEIAPQFLTSLTFLNSSVETRYGTARCNWSRQGEDVLLAIDIPPNASSTLIIPNDYSLKGGAQEWEIRQEDGTAKRIDLENGTYHFRLTQSETANAEMPINTIAEKSQIFSHGHEVYFKELTEKGSGELLIFDVAGRLVLQKQVREIRRGLNTLHTFSKGAINEDVLILKLVIDYPSGRRVYSQKIVHP